MPEHITDNATLAAQVDGITDALAAPVYGANLRPLRGAPLEALREATRRLRNGEVVEPTAIADVDPDEPEAMTNAREVHEQAKRLGQTLRSQPERSTTQGATGNLAEIVSQLAATVTCYIEDNERRLGTHEISNSADVTRLARLEASDRDRGLTFGGVFKRIDALERCRNEAAGVAARVTTLETTSAAHNRAISAVAASGRERDRVASVQAAAVRDLGVRIDRLSGGLDDQHRRIAALESVRPETEAPSEIETLSAASWIAGYDEGVRAAGGNPDAHPRPTVHDAGFDVNARDLAAYNAGWTAALDARDAEDVAEDLDDAETAMAPAEESGDLFDTLALDRIASLLRTFPGDGDREDLAIIAQLVKATGRPVGS